MNDSRHTILSQMMADELNFSQVGQFRITLQRQMQIEFLSQANSNCMVDADVLLSSCFGLLFVADLLVGMEELELYYRCRGRTKFR